MSTRLATCSCGQLSVSCDGDPVLVSLCHCLECQKRTGGTFGIAAFFARDKVAPSGEARTFVRPADSGFDVTFHFCPVCGGTVYWEPGRVPERIAVAVGAFADPTFPPPTRSVYHQHRHDWVVDPVGQAPDTRVQNREAPPSGVDGGASPETAPLRSRPIATPPRVKPA